VTGSELDKRSERLLYMAIIERAVRDLANGSERAKVAAFEWLFGVLDAEDTVWRDKVFQAAEIDRGMLQSSLVNQHTGEI
jgi:hypothetical protein